jgi:uncharacterized protein (TIGR03000 family)
MYHDNDDKRNGDPTMYQKLLSCCGVFVLAGAAFFWTAGVGLAQGRAGAALRGAVPGYHGGYESAGRFGSFHNYYGDYHYYGEHPYTRYYGSTTASGYGTFGSYDYPPPYDSGQYYNPRYDVGFGGSSRVVFPAQGEYRSPAAGTYGAYSASASLDGASLPLDNTARITVKVPANAEVWFEGSQTTSTGRTRTFQSPPLPPARWFTYEVRARWQENGREVTQTQQVRVYADGNFEVMFPASSAKPAL